MRGQEHWGTRANGRGHRHAVQAWGVGGRPGPSGAGAIVVRDAVEITPEDIVTFWLGDAHDDPAAAAQQSERWYQGGKALDQEIRDRFGKLLARLSADSPAAQSEREQWGQTAQGSLALVILLDQFSRHCFRGKAGAFANDALALKVAERAVAAGHDAALSIPARLFLHHPFHHSESIAAQRHYVAFTSELAETVPEEWREFVSGVADYAKRHRNVVTRFGRFPHRNAVLNRVSSADEREYLQNAERHGQ